jgi:hypothetical protein
MRLVESTTLELQEFTSNEVPSYAILSHTWSSDEVSFRDMINHSAQEREGYAKVKLCAQQAVLDGLQWFWIDTACIDKSSSAELSEAINSMYQWYKAARVCYVYLYDAASLDSSSAICRWFSRGWTLQELIAPSHVKFFGIDWCYLGTKQSHRFLLAEITGIDYAVLNGAEPTMCSIARRMSWAAGRQTTRSEDIAYCLMGLFGVNMPLLYGEGDKAFIRLQQEIMKDSDDHTLFAWQDSTAPETAYSGLLAYSPKLFSSTGDFTPLMNRESHAAYSMTNKGLSLQLPFVKMDYKTAFPEGIIFAVALDCCKRSLINRRAIIYLKCQSAEGNQYTRVKTNSIELTRPDLVYTYSIRDVNIKQKPALPYIQAPLSFSGIRVDIGQFLESTGWDLLAEYPQPLDHFLTLNTEYLDYREGPFAVLGFGDDVDGLQLAVILGFKNFMGPCCKIVTEFGQGSYMDELTIAFQNCGRDSMTTLAPNDIIRFPEGKLRALRIWKEEFNGKAIVAVVLLGNYF